MNDFIHVIDAYFSICQKAFNLIMSNWLLALSLLLSIFAIIIDLMLNIKGKNRG